MFATFFEWQVAEDRESEFTAAWEEATRELKAHGSHGSALFRSDDGRLCGFARWPDRETRDSAFAGFTPKSFERMSACLAAPTRRIDLIDVRNLWTDYTEQ